MQRWVRKRLEKRGGVSTWKKIRKKFFCCLGPLNGQTRRRRRRWRKKRKNGRW